MNSEEVLSKSIVRLENISAKEAVDEIGEIVGWDVLRDYALNANRRLEGVEYFWWFNNTKCWKIKREGMVDLYLYLLTMKYIYKTGLGHGLSRWHGTLDPTLSMFKTKEERSETIIFESEEDALAWLSRSG